MKNKSGEIDMTNGPLAGKILLFSLPLIASGMLQLLFNAADVIVVGQYVGSDALAAVSSNTSLINLIINLFVGLSVGAGVTVSFYKGAKDDQGVSEAIHTSVALSIVTGITAMVIGLCVSKFALTLMNVPEKIFDQTLLYLRIYFLGIPAQMFYNFGAASLRAIGNTKHPLYYLAFAGVINVILNLIFVIFCGIGVAGVALATTISQYCSAILVFIHLLRSKGSERLIVSKIRFTASKLTRIITVGLPAGLQSTLFAISNVLIQSSINSFGEIAVAGNSAAGNIEGFIYIAMNAFYHSSQTFVSQNVGAKKPERVRKAFKICMLYVGLVGGIVSAAVYIFAPELLLIYLPDTPEAVNYALQRISVITVTYVLCGFMEVLTGTMRGMGRSVMPMLVSLVGTCILRVVWIYTVFAANPTLQILFISYPVSWILTSSAHFVCYLYSRKKLVKMLLPSA
ncbi:MAG: MATE family efflux transporter [Clostridia bacterium]|nr:MATE family efflux transporter [Clostridia bacterium]